MFILIEFCCFCVEEGQDEYEKDDFIVDDVEEEEEADEEEEKEDSDEERHRKKKKKKKRCVSLYLYCASVVFLCFFYDRSFCD